MVRGVNDTSGAHTQSFYDESGIGIGPFDAGLRASVRRKRRRIGHEFVRRARSMANDATGAAPTKNPLFIAGVDGSGNIKPAVLTAAGALTTGDALAELALGNTSDTAATVNLGCGRQRARRSRSSRRR